MGKGGNNSEYVVRIRLMLYPKGNLCDKTCKLLDAIFVEFV